MWTRIFAVLILLLGGAFGYVLHTTEINGTRPFKLGLDLSGGTHLVYSADVSRTNPSDVPDAMESLRDTIERRVNLFGVAEPLVYVEQASFVSGVRDQRLVVELPGITDTEAAIRALGQTPVLEFRLLKADASPAAQPTTTEAFNQLFEPAAVTGAQLKRATLQFGGQQGGFSNEPIVALEFNAEGAAQFAKLTRENVGRSFGIFLDGVPISIPVIREAIPNGQAVISGGFSPNEAKELVRNLNFGALPLPISLVSTNTVGGTLGAAAVERGIAAGVWGLVAVSIFMLVWYRLPGVVAVLALVLYTVAMLLLFKFIPVTLTAAGIAAFIISIGMAVDANILIFERMREEFAGGKSTREAISDGFARAWLSIRDSNISSIITATILFWFGTSLVQGFALVFGVGVLVSMITAISVSRTLLLALDMDRRHAFVRAFFGSGFTL